MAINQVTSTQPPQSIQPSQRLSGCLGRSFPVLFLLVFGMLCFVDFGAGLALLLGASAFYLLRFIIGFLPPVLKVIARGELTRGGIRPMMAIPAAAPVGFIIAALLALATLINIIVPVIGNIFSGPQPIEQFPMKTYVAVIRPTDFKTGKFELIEQMTLDLENDQVTGTVKTPDFVLPVMQLDGINNGIFSKQILFSPLRADSTGHVSMLLSNGKTISGFLCTTTCPTATIQLVDFPTNTFLEPIGGTDVITLGAGSRNDTEILSWSAATLNHGVGFTYIEHPLLRSVLLPLSDISTLGGKIASGIIGFFSSILAGLTKRLAGAIEKRIWPPAQQPITTEEEPDGLEDRA
jgi:hypothetical protein